MVLTLGIPTYNGAMYIRQTLDSIAAEIAEEPFGRVNVLVSDNASSDETRKIVQEYRDTRLLPIDYSLNDVNLGFDLNVDILFKKATGQFVWLLGDDDVLVKGSIRRVLELIDRYPDVKAIQVNFDKYNSTLERVVQAVSIRQDVYCRDAETFLFEGMGRWGAMSSLVIQRDAWNKCDLSAAFGSQIIFGYGLMQVLLNGHSYILSEPLVKVRDGSEKAVRVGDGDSRISIALASGRLYRWMSSVGYSKKIVTWFLNQDCRYAYESIPLAKKWGIANKSLAIRRLIDVHNGPTLWIKWIPYIMFPDSLFRIFHECRQHVSGLLRPFEKRLKNFLGLQRK